MDGLVHRLRTKAPHPFEGNRVVTDLLTEAADKIERLREALSELADRGTLSSNGELDWLIDEARTALGRNPDTNVAQKEKSNG